MKTLSERELLWIQRCPDSGKNVVILIHSCSNSLNCQYSKDCLFKSDSPESFLKDLKDYGEAVGQEVLKIFEEQLKKKESILCADTISITSIGKKVSKEIEEQLKNNDKIYSDTDSVTIIKGDVKNGK